MQTSNINLFANEEINSKPSTETIEQTTPVKEKKPVDPEEKRKRKNKLIKWLIALVVIGLFVGLIVWSCIPPYKSIKPRSASVAGTSLNIYTSDDTTNPNYVVDLTKPDSVEAYYFAVQGTITTYGVIAETDRGTIEFKMQVSANDDGITFVSIGGTQFGGANQTAPLDSNLEIWTRTITTNAYIASDSVNAWYIILQMLPMLLLIGLMIWGFSRMSKMSGMGSGEDSVFGMGKSQAKIATSNIKFSDVAGIEEEKAELIEIVDYLRNPEKYAAMGARTPKGVILYGPPGTGKTLLAKAVAGEASVPFFQASGSGFEDMLVGVGAKRVRDLFQRAVKAAPSIIFIDEVDSVASKRGKNDIVGGGGGIADQTINQLLAEMDGFNTRTGVVVIAATNRLDVLDDAILRPGRFDRHIQVNLPDIKEREAILKIHARNKNLSSKVNLSDIARRTPGFSGAQLENVLNEATLLAVRENKSAIGMAEIDEAIDRVIAGPAKKTRVITEEEKRQIAYHEAGHALVGLHTKGGDVVEKITIIPRGYAAGYTLSTPEKQELSIQKKSDLLGMVRTTLGGRAAEMVEYGKEAISTGASNDLYKITNVVRAMVTQLGMSDVGMTQFYPSEGQVHPMQTKMFSDETSVKIDKAIEDIIQTEYKNAIDIIKGNKKELDLIVETLLLLETIVKNQIDYIHQNLKLPEEAIVRKKQLADLAKKAKEEAKANEEFKKDLTVQEAKKDSVVDEVKQVEATAKEVKKDSKPKKSSKTSKDEEIKH